MNISKEQLDFLITCPKMIAIPPNAEMSIQSKCRRNSFALQGINSKEKFGVKLRQNIVLPEDFSVILQWQTMERDIILLRCNGPHGGNRKLPLHFVPHIHRLNLELAAQDVFIENDVTSTNGYSTFESAIRYFCTCCGIAAAEKYFPFIIQTSLFDS